MRKPEGLLSVMKNELCGRTNHGWLENSKIKVTIKWNGRTFKQTVRISAVTPVSGDYLSAQGDRDGAIAVDPVEFPDSEIVLTSLVLEKGRLAAYLQIDGRQIGTEDVKVDWVN